MHSTNRFDARWTAMLDDAFAGVGVKVHVQPVVELTTGRVMSYEAFARFDNPQAGGAGPVVWFARARERGQVGELQAAVLREVLSLAPRLPGGALLGVNVEPDAIASPQTREVLLDHGDLTGVVIELTEHAPWSWSEVGPTVTELRARGARMAIDDAGTGYAALEKIAFLDPVTLKLDRSIVSGLAASPDQEIAIDRLGTLARHAGAVLVAEGVESLDDARRLIDCGVPYAQGYLLAPPGPPWPAPDPVAVHALARITAA
ncbi:EAL domain-containing protein [Demequina capsici]|uniref:EAL domain-containing protein n=1 Tax=Demequina capsici TaxID=3075620 RepID=A0AA96JDJ4_9MICO|nr:EAL domain-containing protein [Demequina sp. PMTSA13]WNM28141.1 EAL domain-containing protein [Demequina sp. PMTSA13]